MRKRFKVAIGLSVLLMVGLSYVWNARSTVFTGYTFNAPIERVWNAWTDPATMKQWWGPHGYHSPVVESDLRVDGKFLLAMEADKGGERHYNVGVYKEVIPGKKIASELSFATPDGHLIPGKNVPLPGSWPDHVAVTVEFLQVEGGTRVNVQEVGIPLVMKMFAKMGWDQQFEKLSKLL